MTREEIERRVNRLSYSIFRLVDSFPQTRGADIIAKQILRSSSSVRINYRTLRLAKSRSDFIYKLNVVAEEADETYGWLLFMSELELVKNPNLSELTAESRSLTLLFTKALATSKANNKSKLDG